MPTIPTTASNAHKSMYRIDRNIAGQVLFVITHGIVDMDLGKQKTI